MTTTWLDPRIRMRPQSDTVQQTSVEALMSMIGRRVLADDPDPWAGVTLEERAAIRAEVYRRDALAPRNYG